MVEKESEHKFIWVEKDGRRATYMVKCKKTGGEFSTRLWTELKVQSNKCPCCNERVPRGNRIWWNGN